MVSVFLLGFKRVKRLVVEPIVVKTASNERVSVENTSLEPEGEIISSLWHAKRIAY